MMILNNILINNSLINFKKFFIFFDRKVHECKNKKKKIEKKPEMTFKVRLL